MNNKVVMDKVRDEGFSCFVFLWEGVYLGKEKDDYFIDGFKGAVGILRG